MYYNADSQSFRCYQNGAWQDCITPLPVSKVLTAGVQIDGYDGDIGGLSFDLAANTKYYYKFTIMSESEMSNTGLGFGVTTPSSPVMSSWCVNTKTTLSSTTPGDPGWGSYCGTGDIYTTTLGADSPGNAHTSTMEGYIETDSSSGKLQLRGKAESPNEANIMPGSFGILQVVQ